MSGWTKKEDRILLENYPEEEWDTIYRLLPNRTKYAITVRASFMKITRKQYFKSKDPGPELSELHKRRLAAGINQDDFAQMAGYSPDTIGKWERGLSTPTPLRLQDYKDTLERLGA